MGFLVQLITWVNIVTNTIGGFLLAPVASVPGWLSITVISAILGVFLLVIFKYTSNQKAIGQVRDDIKANLLAVKLFKASFSVTFRSQARVFCASLKLLFYSIVPMLVMIVPVILIMAQMSLWYQARPLLPGDKPVIVKLKFNDNLDTLPQVVLESLPAARTIIGPVRVFTKKEIFWKIKPVEDGSYNLIFHIGDRRYEKQLAVGEGFMRLSPKRPGADFADILLYPLEKPFTSDSPVHSISINYPERNSRIYGTDWWIVYFFVVSMIFAFMFKP
ncbi:MAG: hypothetical protein JRC57_07515, partial [Deltaproteobacteria bacterium]|nr:hypothetical protein [Deltaproteobacteria bacterium]